MIKNRFNSTAVLDSDYIIYIACNGNKTYKNGQPIRKDGKFVYEDKTLEQAINTFDSYMADILHVTKADSYILCMTGKRNFRYDVDPSYKANRANVVKPLWHDEVKSHMIENWDGVLVEALEADDMVNIIKNSLENCFIIAVDKDIIDCIEGTHFDARRGRGYFINTTKSQADYNFAKSMLTGDTIDGIPNIKKGYGPKTAEKELLASTDLDLLETVQKIFLREHPEDGEERFKKQYKLLKIIDSIESLPEGVIFKIPEANCYNCIDTHFSSESYELEFG